MQKELADTLGVRQAVSGWSNKTHISRASTSLNVTIPANRARDFSPNFSLEAGESVTMNCSCSPSAASVDFGLIAPNGHFYYINVTSGSINKSIQVEERGTYTLAVMNNSSSTVSVSGYITY